MTRNYVAEVLDLVNPTGVVGAEVLRVLTSDKTTPAKWNELDKIANAADLILLAFAAGQQRENERLADQIARLF